MTWHDGAFLAITKAGEQLTARHVISATGGFGQPHRPRLPGLDTFAGTVLHSADYRRPDSLAGQRVLVVGAGNSAVQIAVELAQHAEVIVTSRHPVRWVLRTLTGPSGQPALAHDSTPAHRHGVSPTIPGLGFAGLEWQRGFASATIRGVGPDAALVTSRVRRVLGRRSSPPIERAAVTECRGQAAAVQSPSG